MAMEGDALSKEGIVGTSGKQPTFFRIKNSWYSQLYYTFVFRQGSLLWRWKETPSRVEWRSASIRQWGWRVKAIKAAAWRMTEKGEDPGYGTVRYHKRVTLRGATFRILFCSRSGSFSFRVTHLFLCDVEVFFVLLGFCGVDQQ